MNFAVRILHSSRGRSAALALTLLALFTAGAPAQAPGVPVIDDDQLIDGWIERATRLHDQGKLVALETLAAQRIRTVCELALPPIRQEKLDGPAVWDLARRGTLVVALFFHCTECDQWHLNAASGYALTADGAVATCYHVLDPDADVKEGWLIAADLEGQVYPVTEVLAASAATDACIVRIAAGKLLPLALEPDSRPGQSVWCFSHPQDHFASFTPGVISRFFVDRVPWNDEGDPKTNGEQEKRIPTPSPAIDAVPPPVFMAITADFATGSSGGPILDNRGNVVGHVQSTLALFADEAGDDPTTFQTTLKQATPAKAVLALIRPPAVASPTGAH